MPPRQQFHDRCGGLLDRSARHIDDRPMHLNEDPPRLPNLGPHRLDIGILGSVVVMQHVQPVPAQLDQPLGIICQPDDQRAFDFYQLRGQRHPGYKGDIRGFDPTIGEIEAGRGLRGARHPDEADIRIIETPARLPVVMIERKGHGIDAREIACPARLGSRGGETRPTRRSPDRARGSPKPASGGSLPAAIGAGYR